MDTAEDIKKYQEQLISTITDETEVDKLIQKIKNRIKKDPTLKSYFIEARCITNNMKVLMESKGFKFQSAWVYQNEYNVTLIGYDILWK